MRKTNPINKILLVIFSFLLVLTLFFQVIQPSFFYQNLDQKLYEPLSLLRYSLIERPVLSLKETFENLFNYKNLKEENIQLRKQLNAMAQLQAQNLALKKDNEDIQALIDLKNSLTNTYVVEATVINRSTNLFNDELLIDVGSEDGVVENMAIMSSQGLIGLIKQTSAQYSTVKLLTTSKEQAKVSVLVLADEQQELHAVLEDYDVEQGYYTVRLLDSHITVRKGAKIITSGLGNIIPKGLLIGTVEEIDDSLSTVTAIIRVKPATNFSDLTYVLAISKEEPREISHD